MDARLFRCPGSFLARSHPDDLVFLLPLPTVSEDSRQNVQGLFVLSKLQGEHHPRLDEFQYLLENFHADEGTAAEESSKPSRKELNQLTPGKLLCLDLLRRPRIGYLLPLAAAQDQSSSIRQEKKVAAPTSLLLSFNVDGRLPSEVQPNNPLPSILATLRGLELEDGEIALNSGSVWGQASLMSADGRVAMAQIAPDILGGGTVTPLRRMNDCWTLKFDNLVIRQPGYYKININLIQTSQTQGGSDDDPIIEAPQELLSSVTSLIHVHSFAPIRGRIGEMISACRYS